VTDQVARSYPNMPHDELLRLWFGNVRVNQITHSEINLPGRARLSADVMMPARQPRSSALKHFAWTRPSRDVQTKTAPSGAAFGTVIVWREDLSSRESEAVLPGASPRRPS
jgi:hypothetical protein